MICNGIQIGNTCQFTCDNGYVLEGSQARECQSDLTWSGGDTQCQPGICPVISTPHVNVLQPCSGSLESSCSLRCEIGYKFTTAGDDLREVSCEYDSDSMALEWNSTSEYACEGTILF